MKLVSFRLHGASSDERSGALLPIGIVDLTAAAPLLFEDAEERRWDLLSLLENDAEGYGLSMVEQLVDSVLSQIGQEQVTGEMIIEAPLGPMSIGGVDLILPLDSVRLLAPLPRPSSLRDFYAFQQHVAAAFHARGREVPPAWYRMPVFYFANHSSVYGPRDDIPMPRTRQLDYELEIACVVGRVCRDVGEDDAAACIAGYTIMNDWSARDIQREEMSVGLGPAKGKDFATSFGPLFVTPDELADRDTGAGRYDLEMVARINGVERGRGNFRDIHYTFAQMLAHASRDVTLRPGDILGSGTIGGGCLLETTAGKGPWLQAGDEVELEVERLGILRNRVIGREEHW